MHVLGTVQADGFKLTTAPATGSVMTSDAAGNASWQAPAVRSQPNGISPNTIGGSQGNGIAGGAVGATIGGGGNGASPNNVTASYGVIGGGSGNTVSGGSGAIGGGSNNLVNNTLGTVGGGQNNVAGNFAVVDGGANNSAATAYTSVGGGSFNLADGYASAIGGGANNRAANFYSAVGGGAANTNLGYAATIGGGQNNWATNTSATVPGGSGNFAGGQNSFAAGLNAKAMHDGSFVWGDSSTSSAFSSTANNQFLIRAAGGVGIGVTPTSALLDVAGNVRIDQNDLYLRSGTDANHGLGYYGTGKTFATYAVDGPVLYGFSGGVLGTVSPATVVLSWNRSKQVGIGTMTPSQRLSVSGGVNVDDGALNTGSTANALTFGSAGSGEGIGSARSGTVNPFGLDLYTDFIARLSITQGGRVGIGTVAPGELLELQAQDPTINIRNINDGGLGGFIRNTYGALQLGMYNAGAATFGQVAPASKRSFFGFDSSGKVGSLVNDLTVSGSPAYRNLLDDGAGNMSVSSAVNFGATTRQMLNLYNASYGAGVQNSTMYFRSGGGYAWFSGGVHNDNQNNSGGGNTLMTIDSSGNLRTVSGVIASLSDRNVKTNFSPVDGREILARLARLPIQEWNFKHQDAAQRHIGPMAQDFYAAFAVGLDDKSICTVDADGVALAAIQGLNQVLRDQEARLKVRDAEIQDLKKDIGELKSLVNALLQKTPDD